MVRSRNKRTENIEIPRENTRVGRKKLRENFSVSDQGRFEGGGGGGGGGVHE